MEARAAVIVDTVRTAVGKRRARWRTGTRPTYSGWRSGPSSNATTSTPGTIDDVVGGVTRDDMDAPALESRGQANATVIERLG
jgi:hypothetical protein